MNYDNLINSYNNQQFNYTQQEPTPDFLIKSSKGNLDLDTAANAHNLDVYFNQETPYKFPPCIICDDSKRNNHSTDIYLKYMDVITDECGNRFNIRNTNDAAGILQAGYSANIDLDSHLKNINYYTDKCYYDNWKTAPNSNIPACNGLKRNAKILTPDYTPVGRNYKDCIGICSNTAACWNTPPTDINCETDIRKRYDFSNNKFQKENCIQPNEWKPFHKTLSPNAESLQKRKNPNNNREQQIMDSINNGVKHDFYQFFDNSQCVIYPNQRLFNNITKRSMLPNQHFRNIEPIYKQ
jgi:hypothetical protein